MTADDSPYRCEFCGFGLDPEAAGVAKRLTGWVKNGSSSLRRPGPAVAWAHWICVEAGGKPAVEHPGLF